MIYVAEFEKVSFEQFKKDCENINIETTDLDKELRKCYDDIKLPKRNTKGSAGYDFYIPLITTLTPNLPNIIPTGIRCKIDEDWVLMLHPRSSLGFKYGISLANTTGIIDSDYYYSDNEGHIMVKLNTEKTTFIDKGERFVQGIFLHYGVTVDDNATEKRNGGFGSTGK